MKPLRRLLLVLLFVAPAFAAEPDFKLKSGDLWVVAGDSITAQRLHTNYIEAFYRTRYPHEQLKFRNSGIGGNRTGSVLSRFDYDVAAWKPTIVSIELGMNDVNTGDDPAGYIKGMHQLIEKIRAIHAEPVLISSSPVNDGSVMGEWKSDRCRRLDPYTNALKKLAEEEHVVFVDQYHPLLELWGKNSARQPKGDPKDRSKDAQSGYIALHGDAVHPGSVGQYTMAATILAGLHVDPEVSSATMKADGSTVESAHCKITDVSAKDGTLSFTRLDDRGPWPIDPPARSAIDLLPAVADLSRYMLTVSGLAPGNYQVIINDKPAAVVSDKTLAAGWNLTTVFEGALADRSTNILKLIDKLEKPLNNDWRAASKAHDEQKLAAAQKAIDECEAEITQACQPTPLRFKILEKR